MLKSQHDFPLFSVIKFEFCHHNVIMSLWEASWPHSLSASKAVFTKSPCDLKISPLLRLYRERLSVKDLKLARTFLHIWKCSPFLTFGHWIQKTALQRGHILRELGSAAVRQKYCMVSVTLKDWILPEYVWVNRCKYA